jgi:mRNA interferase MazF
VTRGEIWSFRFAAPDKQRPVLLLTRSDMIPVLDTVTVAPITRTRRGVASEVEVGAECGLKERSAVNLHHVVTIPRAGLRRRIGVVPPDVMDAVRDALLFALGWSDPETL